ncbi:MAG: hypothetical protein E2P02_10455 [Acidobacteria bacterium]|nr:MAG: hypothetical protein E2P02_10455 [Acidobacteriota bacterium]
MRREGGKLSWLATVPAVCILDPAGDIVHSLLSEGRSRRDERWACYHTTLYRFELGRVELGIRTGSRS